MISLIFDYNYYKDLYGEYKKERETFENFLFIANILGY